VKIKGNANKINNKGNIFMPSINSPLWPPQTGLLMSITESMCVLFLAKTKDSAGLKTK